VSTLRLGSFNLLSGRSVSDGLIESGRLVTAIGELADGGLDLLAVQEVDRSQPRSGGIDQAAVIADTMGAVAGRFIATLNGTPGESGWTPVDDELDGVELGRADRGHAELGRVDHGQADDGRVSTARPQYGVALISRLPVAEWHLLRLPPAPGRYPLPLPGPPTRPPRWRLVKDEPRVVVAAVLQQPRITIACTHLSFVPLSNARQLRMVRRWLAELPGPQILLGDLNLPGDLPRRITRWTPLVSGPTFPSPSPRLQLDHVLAADLPSGSSAQGWIRQLPISDHRAVRVNLDLPS
jgi:endonuclease/exonuclease/phosphatase family metal-dependent hydrolase